MAWVLNARGESTDENGLIAELKAVLSKLEHGTTASSLTSDEVRADPLHEEPAEPAAG